MAKNWQEIEIINDKGEKVIASAPVIVSASRATDIPAFFSKWFMNRLNEGYVKWTNPFNRTTPYYISLYKVRAIIFWTKNPKPIIPYLDELDKRNINYYFQFSLNDYEIEGFEPNVPALNERIETFQQLSNQIGNEKVIWRFDPLILSDNLTVDDLLKKIENLSEKLVKYTDKLVFSFVDINEYPKVQANLIKDIPNLSKGSLFFKEFSKEQKIEFADGIGKLLEGWQTVNKDFRISTCAEDIDLNKYNIEHNKCIDDELLIKLFNKDAELMDFLGHDPNASLFETKKPNLKDKGQRKACGCIISKDIGAYNTCNHLCSYCYANSSRKMVEKKISGFDEEKDSI
ncbi:MAG: DUF1848 domain-containing protein [Candidatus Kapabacteria bacterium]|nr:DUF1848 domain-containing protein [Candidatus Kapabacteria bacterium]